MINRNMGNTDYATEMAELDREYRALIRQAGRVREAHNDLGSVEEARLYEKASIVCEKIIAKNIGDSAVKTQWTVRKKDCIDEMEKIVNYLRPQDTVKKESSDVPNSETDKKDEKVSGASASTNAAEYVSAETIKSWHCESPKHTFADVSGMEELKKRLNRVIGRIGYEKLAQSLGIPNATSIFFYGPTGSGKTFIIEAFIAELMAECKFNYLYLTPGDITSKYVGEAEKIVAAAFHEAIDCAPCILFIDEIEVLLQNRGSEGAEGHEKRTTVAFLNALNDVMRSEKTVIFVGATNHPGNIDLPLLNRLSGFYGVPLPPVEARKAFFERKIKLPLADDIDVDYMAEITESYSYRDLDNLVGAIGAVVLENAIDKYAELDENGRDKDKDATMARADEAIKSGEYCFDYAVFEKCRAANPPSPKEDMVKEIEEFEAKMMGSVPKAPAEDEPAEPKSYSVFNDDTAW